MAAPATTIPAAPMPTRPSWIHDLLQDLAPNPGRLASALRIVLASVVALVIMEALQMPFISIGMYFIFLISRDSPAISLRTSLFSFAIVVLAILVELAVVILSDNDPVVRLLSVTAVTFVAGMIVVTTNYPQLGSSFGLIYCTVIALWERHLPADRLVKTSLYLVGTFLISLGCAVAVEYLFGARHPAQALQEQRRIRYTALEALFRAYARNAPPAERFEAASRVSRIAIAGQSGMMSLYNTIVDRNLDPGSLPIATRPRITMLAQLMDVSAAFGLQNPPEVDPDTQTRCARIADECRRITPGLPPEPGSRLELVHRGQYGLLDRVEGSLHAILTMPMDLSPLKSKDLVALPSHKIPFFIPGAIRNRENVAFGLKICLCATFCYIFYNAVAWPGISTSVTTVLVTGLSSSAATKQRLVFRLLGSIIGGLLLGLGAISFLFPHMDSITSLVVLEAAIAFLSAWVAAGPKFNYIGLQMAFAFYLVAFESFSSPTELAPARDRFVGIVIALAAMWLVFDQLWPIRTTTVMRRSFAAVLRIGADLFTLLNSTGDRDEILRHADSLRDRLGKLVAGIRSANTAVPYEFGLARDQHIQTGDQILRATLTAAAIFWNQLALLHNEQDIDFLADPGLRTMRGKLATDMNTLAEDTLTQAPVEIKPASVFLDATLLNHPRFGEYARNTMARFEELENFTAIFTQST
jgi:multidrug resistance protein MdtO